MIFTRAALFAPAAYCILLALMDPKTDLWLSICFAVVAMTQWGLLRRIEALEARRAPPPAADRSKAPAADG
jgi:hypothetical protein